VTANIHINVTVVKTIIFLNKKENLMANKVKGVKSGMGGSRCGKGRSEKTAVMKKCGKKARRREDRVAVYSKE
jgi:hypothetical protein